MSRTLTSFDLFQGLTEEDCQLIENNGKWILAQQGQMIIAEHQSNDSLFLIAEGAVDVRLTDHMNYEIVLARHGVGMMIGEYSLVDGLPAAASAVPSADSVLFAIPHEKLNQIFAQNDRIGRIVYKNLLKILVRRLRDANAELDLFRY